MLKKVHAVISGRYNPAPPGGIGQCLATFVVLTADWDATGIRWVATRGTAKYPTMHWTAPAAKYDPVEHTKFEKPWLRLIQKCIVCSDHTQQMAGVSLGETLAPL